MRITKRGRVSFRAWQSDGTAAERRATAVASGFSKEILKLHGQVS